MPIGPVPFVLFGTMLLVAVLFFSATWHGKAK